MIGLSVWSTTSATRSRPILRSKNSTAAPLPPPLPEYPKVSVVVCVYNGERTIDACLASLEKLNYPNYEVVVVNDGSTDGTREIAESYDYIRLINQDNEGPERGAQRRHSGRHAAKLLRLPTPIASPMRIG